MKKYLSLILAVIMLFALAVPAYADAPTATVTVSGVFGEPIVVEVVADETTIYEVNILEQNETPGLGAVAAEKIPAAIVGANAVEVDSMTGATVTSDAIKAAVAEALTSLGFDPASYQGAAAEPAGPAEKTAGTLDCDVVVIGAGGAGMTAAITASDAGAKVLVLESMALPGGNSVRSTGGMNAAPTEWQQANTFGEGAGVEATLKKVANYPDNERIQELGKIVAEQWAAYQADPQGYFDSAELFQLDTLIGGGGKNDPSLVKKLAESSESAIAWLGSLEPEVILHNVAAFGGASVKRIHRPVDENGKTLSVGAYVVPLLQQNLEKRGIEILTETPAVEILTDEHGCAVGVKAEGADATYTINAKAVVIASGGFGANNDMIKAVRPELDGFITTNAPGIQGQGIQMAQAIGADTVDLAEIQLHPTVHVEGSAAVLITEGLRGDGAILVNQEGERFFDEVSTRDKVSAAEFEQTGGYAWLIVDSRMADASNVIQGYINKGYAEKGDTYVALANAIGAPVEAFVETMTAWNACVAAKEDPDFGRVSFANPLDQAPFYAIKVQPGVHHTMGGIKINDSAEVISTDGAVIPGLFAAGEVTGGVHGNNRLGGNAVADFTIFGRIAGQSAADFAKAEPAEEPAPAEEAAPAEEPAPAEEAAPAEEPAPAEEATPAEEAAPAESVEPDSGIYTAVSKSKGFSFDYDSKYVADELPNGSITIYAGMDAGIPCVNVTLMEKEIMGVQNASDAESYLAALSEAVVLEKGDAISSAPAALPSPAEDRDISGFSYAFSDEDIDGDVICVYYAENQPDGELVVFSGSALEGDLSTVDEILQLALESFRPAA